MKRIILFIINLFAPFSPNRKCYKKDCPNFEQLSGRYADEQEADDIIHKLYTCKQCRIRKKMI